MRRHDRSSDARLAGDGLDHDGVEAGVGEDVEGGIE